MTVEEIRNYRNAQPFQPFVMLMADGRTISVADRLRLGIVPWGKVGVYEGPRFHLVAPADVVAIRLGVSTLK